MVTIANNITFDITKIEDGKSTNLDQIMSKPEKCNLPKTIASFEGKNYSVKKLKHGTIIHYEELDRISPKTINTLENRLMEDFGQNRFDQVFLKYDLKKNTYKK